MPTDRTKGPGEACSIQSNKPAPAQACHHKTIKSDLTVHFSDQGDIAMLKVECIDCHQKFKFKNAIGLFNEGYSAVLQLDLT